MPTKQGEKPNFETAVERLQSIVKRMEQDELTLEDSLKYFEEGVKLIHKCQGTLDEAQQKVKLLTEQYQGSKLEDFEDPSPS